MITVTPVRAAMTFPVTIPVIISDVALTIAPVPVPISVNVLLMLVVVLDVGRILGEGRGAIHGNTERCD